jgi:hypothetical protein
LVVPAAAAFKSGRTTIAHAVAAGIVWWNAQLFHRAVLLVAIRIADACASDALLREGANIAAGSTVIRVGIDPLAAVRAARVIGVVEAATSGVSRTRTGVGTTGRYTLGILTKFADGTGVVAAATMFWADRCLEDPPIAALEIWVVWEWSTERATAGLVPGATRLPPAAMAVRWATFTAARLSFLAAFGDLRRGTVGLCSIDDTELAGVVSVALAADELAVVDLLLVANPNRLRGTSATAAWRRLGLGFALVFFAVPVMFLLVLVSLRSGRQRIAQEMPSDERAGNMESRTPGTGARQPLAQCVEPMSVGHGWITVRWERR